MILKLTTHVVVFALGAAGGIFWGVHNPQEAQSVADLEQRDALKIKAALAQGRQQALQQVVTDQSPTTESGAPAAGSHVDKYKKMLQDAQQDFNYAASKITN